MVYHESKIIAYLFTFVDSLQLKGILPTSVSISMNNMAKT